MRITVVSRIFAPEPGAASERLAVLCRELSSRGHEVTVVTTNPPSGCRDETPRQYAVRRWPVVRDRNGYVRGYIPYLSFDVPAFFRVLFGRRSDLIVVEPPPTTGFFQRIAAMLRGTRYAYYAADIVSLAAESTGAPHWIVRVVRAMERWSLRGAVVVLAVTDGVADRVRVLAPGSRVEVVGHGVDERTFNSAVVAGASADVVYVGTASEWHGADVLIEALGLVRDRGYDITARFVGQGTGWQGLQDRVREHALQDRVTFGPPVSGVQAAAILRGARVALSSIRPGSGYDFAVPTKAYSALAVGTPVLYSGPEPTRGIFAANGLGEGCDESPDAIAEALIRLLSQPLTDESRAHISAWAAENLSGRAVARRAADILTAADARDAGHGGRAGTNR